MVVVPLVFRSPASHVKLLAAKVWVPASSPPARLKLFQLIVPVAVSTPPVRLATPEPVTLTDEPFAKVPPLRRLSVPPETVTVPEFRSGILKFVTPAVLL